MANVRLPSLASLGLPGFTSNPNSAHPSSPSEQPLSKRPSPDAPQATIPTVNTSRSLNSSFEGLLLERSTTSGANACSRVKIPWELLGAYFADLQNTRALREDDPLRRVARALSDPGVRLPREFEEHAPLANLLHSRQATSLPSTPYFSSSATLRPLLNDVPMSASRREVVASPPLTSWHPPRQHASLMDLARAGEVLSSSALWDPRGSTRSPVEDLTFSGFSREQRPPPLRQDWQPYDINMGVPARRPNLQYEGSSTRTFLPDTLLPPSPPRTGLMQAGTAPSTDRPSSEVLRRRLSQP